MAELQRILHVEDDHDIRDKSNLLPIMFTGICGSDRPRSITSQMRFTISNGVDSGIGEPVLLAIWHATP